ncbi:MAG: DUF5662 family protein [Aeromonas jandaei]
MENNRTKYCRYKTKEDAECAYNDYINNHRMRVVTAYHRLGRFIFKDMPQLGLDVNTHDNTKYSKSEYDAYRIMFFRCEEDYGDIEDVAGIEQMNEVFKYNFEIAWQHHYEHNDHHPEYWVKRNKMMPKFAMAHMLLDWIAMAQNKPGDSAHKYYMEHREEKMKYGVLDIPWLENMLEKYGKSYNVVSEKVQGKHYYNGGFDTWDVTDDWELTRISNIYIPAAIFNIFKYVDRAGNKAGEDTLKDISKAKHYAESFLNRFGYDLDFVKIIPNKYTLEYMQEHKQWNSQKYDIIKALMNLDMKKVVELCVQYDPQK